jgi:hypothetical protein
VMGCLPDSYDIPGHLDNGQPKVCLAEYASLF